MGALDKVQFNVSLFLCSFCCGSTIIPIADVGTCCGDTQYVPEEQHCCGDVLVGLPAKDTCCGNTSFNSSSQVRTDWSYN